MSDKDLDSDDHYYSQICIRHFSFLPGFVFAYRKKEKLERKVPISSICFERGGDICESFENKFGLRQLLRKIEPAWNHFIDSVINKNIYEVHAIQSQNHEIPFLERVFFHIAYLRCLSPTLLRLIKEQQEEVINKVMLPLLANSQHPQLDESTRMLLKSGGIKVEIGNKDYYKNEIMNILADMAQDLYNRKWVILENRTDIKFITSDTPVISLSNGQLYIPLTPEYALLFLPYPASDTIYESINEQQVMDYNEEMVKWATDWVLSSEENLVISKLVDKYRSYQVSNDMMIIPEEGFYRVFFQHKATVRL